MLDVKPNTQSKLSFLWQGLQVLGSFIPHHLKVLVSLLTTVKQPFDGIFMQSKFRCLENKIKMISPIKRSYFSVIKLKSYAQLLKADGVRVIASQNQSLQIHPKMPLHKQLFKGSQGKTVCTREGSAPPENAQHYFSNVGRWLSRTALSVTSIDRVMKWFHRTLRPKLRADFAQ